MKRIYKYQLDSVYSNHYMPIGAKILTVQIQNRIPTIWAIIDDDVDGENLRQFIIHGTGHEMPEYDKRSDKYIGTVQDGAIVLHIFEIV